MLVYVLARNGTLFDYIHHVNGKKALSWHILLKIASESAAALAYLHSAAETSKPMIIHGNVNSSNILLSDCFVAKVFGFGSSRLVRVPSNESQMNTLVQQTVGYLDPEYLQTEQNDIFQIVVPQLVNEGNREQLRAVAELAKSCLKLSSAERPAMEEVARELRRLCGRAAHILS
nr:putative wall-associated receptor kinase-like 16 [Malus domestica]